MTPDHVAHHIKPKTPRTDAFRILYGYRCPDGAIEAYEILEKQNAELLEALQMLHDETADYITLNHLGDPHHNQSMKLARAAIKKATE